VALDRESDLVFARDAMPASLKTLETFLINSPNNQDLLFLLTKGFNAYALLFLEGDLEKARLEGTEREVESLNRRAVLHYLRARTYGFILLNYVELEEAALSGDLEALGKALEGLQKDDVPALFWTTQAWASAINLSQDDPDMVGALPVVEKMMRRVMKLDGNYLAGSPYIFMGSFFASRPRMFGGDPDEAKKYFQTALERYGEVNLLVPYMFGRLYAVQVQDRALFNNMMAKVLEAEVTEHPDFRLQNEAARERARFWVDHVDDLFFE
jgi:tetratricopeptide (TPR) repeat protein